MVSIPFGHTDGLHSWVGKLDDAIVLEHQGDIGIVGKGIGVGAIAVVGGPSGIVVGVVVEAVERAAIVGDDFQRGVASGLKPADGGRHIRKDCTSVHIRARVGSALVTDDGHLVVYVLTIDGDISIAGDVLQGVGVVAQVVGSALRERHIAENLHAVELHTLHMIGIVTLIHLQRKVGVHVDLRRCIADVRVAVYFHLCVVDGEVNIALHVGVAYRRDSHKIAPHRRILRHGINLSLCLVRQINGNALCGR